ncbi:MAG: PQQ-dependent sugar dehydrogenase [Gemmatimonadales bacterium]
MHVMGRGGMVLIGGAVLMAAAMHHSSPVTRDPSPVTHHPSPCASDNAGLVLPTGFCATLFADGVGAVRHLIALPNGDIIAARASGGMILLRDTTGNGRADVTSVFGEGRGTGIAYADGWLYFAPDDRVVRYRWTPGQLVPTAPPQVIVRDLPAGGNHTAKPIVVRAGTLYVDFGSATNSCQVDDRAPRSPGHDPCPEREIRAGIWTFDAARADQTPANGVHFGVGLRNPMALAFEPTTGMLWMAVHGRDQLGEDWGFSDSLNAELPAEEFGPVVKGADYGWPYCYYDELRSKKVTAPEYGGDGTKTDRCAGKTVPVIGFPGHWAPMALTFYAGTAFPAEYRGGAFLAFHGSWNRAPLPQAGFRIVFVPFRNGRATGEYTTFATAKPGVLFRPAGLAVGPDGALYIGSDGARKVWRVIAAN